MKKMNLVVFTGIILLLVGCASSNSLIDENGVYNIEAEKMTFSNAEIVALDGASGGSGIKLLTPEAFGFFELELPIGEYVVNAYINAPDGDHDAFYIIADDKQVQRVYPPKHNQMSYCSKFLTFKVETAGLHMIRVSSNWPGQKAGEIDMIIDKLEIVPAEKSVPVIEKWVNQ